MHISSVETEDGQISPVSHRSDAADGKQRIQADLRYNFDKTADFSKFKTYVWVTIKNVAGHCCHPNLPELFTGTRLAA